MRRRQVIVGLGAVSAWPVIAQQATKVPRIGFLWESPDLWPAALESFRRGLRDLGWIEGRRSEERRVGKECRSRCDWSSDVCSSDLQSPPHWIPLGES